MPCLPKFSPPGSKVLSDNHNKCFQAGIASRLRSQINRCMRPGADFTCPPIGSPVFFAWRCYAIRARIA
jgi:hypothetical protein